MKLRILQLKLTADYTPDELHKAAAKRLKIHPNDLKQTAILRRSIDARDRNRGQVYYILNVTAETQIDINTDTLWQVEAELPQSTEPARVTPIYSSPNRPIVIGAGPAGLFAAYQLALLNLKPIVFEQGKTVNERRKDVGKFWGKGILNPQSNVLFGEGGAGTFSDGKITSRSKDRRRTSIVRKVFFENGAAEEVLYDSAFHIGSDRLATIVPSIRRKTIELGGEFHFNRKLTGLHIEDKRLRGITVDSEEIETDFCYLGTGHSAYDIYHLLERSGAILEAKPFATGIRLEIPQKSINMSQYGTDEYTSLLGPAPFSLTLNKDCYTFCMCPGGSIIPCSTETGSLFTNGMSLSTRSGMMGNAAFLLPQKFNTFTEGYDFIKQQENAAYNAGNNDFALPVTTLTDFPFACKTLPENRSCRRAVSADFSRILPEKMCSDLKNYLPEMLKKMKGVDPDAAVIMGPETRSSAPVRILRNEHMECTEISGLFPIGEGAGYAGGIMSSAIDGIKAVDVSLSTRV